MMESFVLSFFPPDVLDEIWDLTESVSEGFLTYSLILFELWLWVDLDLFYGKAKYWKLLENEKNLKTFYPGMLKKMTLD